MGEVKKAYRLIPGDTIDCYAVAHFITDMKERQNGKVHCRELENCQRRHGGEKEAEFGMCIAARGAAGTVGRLPECFAAAWCR